METINQQLNIDPVNRNSNIRSRMARGANTYQVQLGTEDPSLDFYNDIQSISNYHNANGWDLASGCRDIGNESFEQKDEYNEFLGIGYPPCVNLRCKNCKNECKTTKGLTWRDGGKECHKTCVLNSKNEQIDRIQELQNGGVNSDAVKSGEIIAQEETEITEGMGMGIKVAIGVSVIAIIGVAVYMIRKKKS
jgi:hypothetical protein